MTDPFIAGLLLFFVGMVINWQSDTILINLRKPGETAYVIPMKGFFRYVSCPNHFGEIIEWLGICPDDMRACPALPLPCGPS